MAFFKLIYLFPKQFTVGLSLRNKEAGRDMLIPACPPCARHVSAICPPYVCLGRASKPCPPCVCFGLAFKPCPPCATMCPPCLSLSARCFPFIRSLSAFVRVYVLALAELLSARCPVFGLCMVLVRAFV